MLEHNSTSNFQFLQIIKKEEEGIIIKVMETRGPHSTPEKRKGNESTVFGVTKSESVKGSLHWKIVRFKDLDKRVGEYCESPEFTVGDYKWYTAISL